MAYQLWRKWKSAIKLNFIQGVNIYSRYKSNSDFRANILEVDWTYPDRLDAAIFDIYIYICHFICEDTGCCPEDLPEAINDREKWRERVRNIRATSTT